MTAGATDLGCWTIELIGVAGCICRMFEVRGPPSGIASEDIIGEAVLAPEATPAPRPDGDADFSVVRPLPTCGVTPRWVFASTWEMPSAPLAVQSASLGEGRPPAISKAAILPKFAATAICCSPTVSSSSSLPTAVASAA